MCMVKFCSTFLLLSTIFLLFIHDTTCRKSDYKRIIFSDYVKDKLKDLYEQQYNLTEETLKQEYDSVNKDEFKLNRLQPEKTLGSIRNITLKDNRKKWLQLRTVSKRRPLIFEIDDFLFDDECEHIKELALKAGLEESLTTGEAIQLNGPHITIFDDLVGIEFKEIDIDENKVVNLTEMARFVQTTIDLKLSDLIMRDIARKTYMDFNMDDLMEEWEWKSKNLTRLVEVLMETKEANPTSKSRFSQQAWLTQTGVDDEILLSLQDRLHKLTGLPLLMIQNSELLQVVRYKPGGHYDCHLDSDPRYYQDNFTPCCHYDFALDGDFDCAACRFMTVLFYLDDTPLGGQTAFPVAGVDPYTNDLADESGGSSESWCDLTTNCRESKIRIHPKKGRAVLWYNHFIDPDTEWLGSVDRNSLHGGCAVHQGTKWIANNWINAGYRKDHDILNWLFQQHYRENMKDESEQDLADDVDESLHDAGIKNNEVD